MQDVLETARCRLRDFAERDLPAFVRYRATPEVAHFQSWSSYTLEDAQRLYAAQRVTPFGKAGSWYQVAIAGKDDDRLIGDCALHFLEDGWQVEIGFTLAPEYQGKGLAREAVTALLEYVFGKLGKHRVIAVTDAENHSAQKLLRGLGFRQEAHYRQNIFFKGKWGDECLFALLAEEFRPNKP